MGRESFGTLAVLISDKGKAWVVSHKVKIDKKEARSKLAMPTPPLICQTFHC